MESSTTPGFLSHRSNSRETLDLLLCGANSELAFADPEGIFFTQTSTADVFDIRDGKGTLFSDLHDDQLRASLEVSPFVPSISIGRRTLYLTVDIRWYMLT